MSDKVLSFVFDSFPIVLAIIGIVISYHPPHSRAKKITATIILLFIGTAGCWALREFHLRIDETHSKEIAQLSTKLDATSAKLDAAGKTNDLILKGLTKRTGTPDVSTPSEKEVVRRQKILAALRNEYVLSHDNVSTAVMSGVQSPPADWVNGRLKELGEKWRIGDQYQPPALPPEVRCAMDISDCSNQNIKDKATQIADVLDAAFSKYVRYQNAPVEQGKENRHAAILSTMRTMTIRQYEGDIEMNVKKYRQELVKRVGLPDSDRTYDYLYQSSRQHEMEDFREIARDLRNLVTRLP
jgi:hypothetical protein